MAFFLVVYFVVYGGMNAYVCLRLRQGLAAGGLVTGLLALLFLLMLLAPMLVRHLDENAPFWLARACALGAWSWMALVFWSVMLFLAADAWNLGCRLATSLSRAPAAAVEQVARETAAPRPQAAQVPAAPAGGWRAGLSPRRQLWAALVLLPLLCAWGLIEAGHVALRTVKIASPRLPAGTPPLRLVQISDLHLGLTSRADVLRQTLARIREANPDVLVATGDFVDAAGPEMDKRLQPFADLQPPLGKFAVLGNHEFYPGLERSLALLAVAGFRVLREEAVDLGSAWRLAGVDDPRGRPPSKGGQWHDDRALPATRDVRYTILLKHQPMDTQAARQRADLQLSGHTHRGQVFPFVWFVRLFHPYPHSVLLNLPEGLQLYVSPGTGTWGPPFRVLAPPEVTLFIIRPTQ